MKIKTFIFVLIFIAVAIVWIACGTSTMKDREVQNNDDKAYKTIKIGYQVWMAENLNIVTSSGSWCYGDEPANCDKYGRLYDWETAKTVCPSGWHLPAKSDFETLLSNFNGEGSDAYSALIAGGSSGFELMRGGCRTYDGNYGLLETEGFLWSSSEGDVYGEWHLVINYYKKIELHRDHWDMGLSVRCLQDL